MVRDEECVEACVDPFDARLEDVRERDEVRVEERVVARAVERKDEREDEVLFVRPDPRVAWNCLSPRSAT